MELQGHMQAAGTTERKALCGEPDAYIIDVGFDLGPTAEDGVSCERCLASIRRLRQQAARRRRVRGGV